MYRSTAMRSIASLSTRRVSLRPAAPSVLAHAQAQAQRKASTLNPTPASGPPSPEEQTRLRPGEEIDPQLQGYPQLPYQFNQSRPARGWWDAQNRRNFGETLHEEADMLSIFGPDVTPVSGPKAAAQIAVALTIVGLIAYAGTFVLPGPSAIPREYPYNGLEKEYGGEGTWHPRAEVDRDEE